MTELNAEELERRLYDSLVEATRLAPLARPEWSGPSGEACVGARAGSRTWRLAIVGGAVAIAAMAAALVLTRPGDGSRVTFGPPTSSSAGPAPRSAVDPAFGPPGTWAAGTGPPTPLGQVVELRADPVARASLAVQVGAGSRWVWAVAGAADRRLRSALDSSVPAPATLSADGGRLAVAFPGLVKVVDLSSGEVRDLPSYLVGGPARYIAWSPNGRAVGVLRGGGDPQQGSAGPSIIEVLGVDGSVRRFTTAAAAAIDWSPDGSRLLTTGAGLGLVTGSFDVVDVSAGTAVSIPPGRGALVGWYDDRTLLRSQVGLPRQEGTPAPSGTTTTLAPRPGSPQGAIEFLDLDGNVMRRLETADGSLDQLGPPLDPTRRYGLLQVTQGGGDLPYAAVVDLETGVTVGRPTDRRAVPIVIGLGAGTVVVADELTGRFEVKAVDWVTGRATPLATLPYQDEGSRFAPSLGVALPR